MRPTWIFCLDNGPRRVNHSAVMIDQRIFMFGGYCSGEDYETIKCIDIHTFNTVSHVWKKVHCRNKELDLKYCNQPSEVPYMRYGHASVAIRDEVYLFGGRNESLGACKTLYSFNTSELKWHIPPVGGFNPGARDGHAMCVARGNIYLFGGYEAEAERFSDETFLLDMQSMVWTLVETKGVQPRWRDFHTITAHDDKIYLFGGRGDVFGPFPSNSELYDNELRVLDLDTSSWSTPAKRDQKMPIGRRSHTAFFHKGCLYVFGGYNSDKNEHFNDLWKYDPVTDLWSSPITDGSVPSGRRRHCCCYSDNKVFIFGGTSPCLRKNEENNNETSRKIDGLSLYDHSDTYMLDFEPSLKTLCINAVLKNNLDISCLPNDLFHSRPTLSRG